MFWNTVIWCDMKTGHTSYACRLVRALNRNMELRGCERDTLYEAHATYQLISTTVSSIAQTTIKSCWKLPQSVVQKYDLELP